MDPGNWYAASTWFASDYCSDHICNYITKTSPFNDYFTTISGAYHNNNITIDAHRHIGNYYNWSAAIASNDSSDIGSVVGQVAQNSICPKGWRLPVPAEYTALNDLYNGGKTGSGPNRDTGLFNSPWYGVRSGAVGEILFNAGYYGGYWSSVVYNNPKAHNLYFRSDNVIPQNSGHNRYHGFSVRCIAN